MSVPPVEEGIQVIAPPSIGIRQDGGRGVWAGPGGRTGSVEGERDMKMLRSVLCGLALWQGVSVSAQTSGPPTPAKATVAQLAFVTGAWTGTLGDRIVEQHWSAPKAGSIVAMYRSIRADKPTLYELLAIEQDGEGVALRIKHFAPGAGLVSQEAKDQSMDHVLVSVGEARAVFVGGTADASVRITFVKAGPDALTITVERQRDGQPVSTEFKYTRIQ
jgi:hypothetical protein